MAEVWRRTWTTRLVGRHGRTSPGAGDLMLERPRFKPHLRVEVVPGEGAFVLFGGSQTLLRGSLYERVAPLIGGGRSADDVCDELRGQVSPAEVYYVITQ